MTNGTYLDWAIGSELNGISVSAAIDKSAFVARFANELADIDMIFSRREYGMVDMGFNQSTPNLISSVGNIP
jgi:hypothetical protein